MNSSGRDQLTSFDFCFGDKISFPCLSEKGIGKANLAKIYEVVLDDLVRKLNSYLNSNFVI